MSSIYGRALRYGDNINTDLISPSRYAERGEMVAHAMEGVDPDFPQKVRPGDILVAGKNFGSGSSRESAPYILRESGIAVIVAEFFARIFYRNAINIGLPVLTTGSVAGIRDGDELEVNLTAGRIRNLATGGEFVCDCLPEHILAIVRDGGLIPHLERRIKEERADSIR